MRALTGSCAFRARASARRGDQSGTSSSSSSSSSRPPRPPRRAEASDERRLELDRRSWTLIAATTIALSRSTTPTRAALAYGLNKPPPSNDGGFFGLGASKKPRRSYAEIMAAREEAERRREELEAEANPGVLVTMDSGLQYREMDVGRPSGKVAAKGDEMFVLYKVFRLAPGAYFKYSSGGTPILMFSQGYGYEGQVRARVRRPSIRIRIRLDRAVGRVGARDETLTDRIESSNQPTNHLPSFLPRASTGRRRRAVRLRAGLRRDASRRLARVVRDARGREAKDTRAPECGVGERRRETESAVVRRESAAREPPRGAAARGGGRVEDT
jgi:hypothetical protein